MKRDLLLGSLIATGALTVASSAMAQDVSWSIGGDYVSEYVFRGTSLGTDSIQPYVEVSAGNFTAGTWFSTAVGANSELSGDEIDFYASYSLPLEGSVSVDIGGTYYHYPQGGALLETEGGGAGSYEVFASAGFDAPFAPSLTAYYDFTLEAFTLEGAAGHSVPLAESVSLDLGLTLGLVDGDGFSYQWGQVGAAFSKAITDDASIYVGANFVLNSDDNTLDLDTFADPLTGDAFQAATDDTLFWFGSGISTSF